ncbi:MAG: CRISPR-associated endonuclease Cas1 [Bryobacterales bacterium]|nr:CRISPR-associated endonuclease Cas1 [Bryobacterales bacterium]
MVNEFCYCPRLFFYEWVEGVFRESADTVEGAAQHARVDREGAGLPSPEELDEDLRTRAVTLSSDRHRLIAKMDLLDVAQGTVTPVDYKHGKPRDAGHELAAWPSDRVQLAVQAIVLRENGYTCDEGIVFYAGTRQRVRVPFDAALIEETLSLVEQAWECAREGAIPPPLDDSPKCNGCSLVPICLPDETNALRAREFETTGPQLPLFPGEPPRKGPAQERGTVRQLVTPRSELRPAYLDTQGLRVGKSGDVLQVKEKDTVKQQIRMGEICQLNLMGNIQISTQAVQTLCERGVPVCYFSQGGWFYGITTGMNTKNVFLRRTQFRLAEEAWFCLRLARKLVAGKIRNQRTMLLRNHVEPPARVLAEMKAMVERAESAASLEELLGIEGNAARLYFQAFNGMLKADDDREAPEIFRMDFTARNRRPPRDAVNALLSLAYSMLAKDLMVTCYAVGFDPLIGFYHQPRFGRPALALDLMEPFRPLVADSAVLNAINTRMVTPSDFLAVGQSVALKPAGRKAFYRAYELRMDSLVTHPQFDYRVSYRRLLEIQARLLARWMEGEVDDYPVFVTR